MTDQEWIDYAKIKYGEYAHEYIITDYKAALRREIGKLILYHQETGRMAQEGRHIELGELRRFLELIDTVTPESANTAMKADIRQKIEEWCDWACGDLPRTSDKWKAANLGAIKGASLMQEEVGLLTIERDQAKRLRESCESALAERNQTIESQAKEIERLREILRRIQSNGIAEGQIRQIVKDLLKTKQP